ncbi:SWF or SNF family helicase [Streptomyces sp. NPDC051684]|uniref:SWF or SNF family helicase n=1 Tax=Streptomyces sp. NPDC051684 TaxID=3365670 RepID=UPI003792B854
MSHREDDMRTFAALPPERGRAFAGTWWGQAWLKALEDTALDTAQLKAGRRLARAGAVGAVSVRPGRITAVVEDRGGATYRSDVLLQCLDEDEWDGFLTMAAERAGHIAALLDRDMPPHLVEDASASGVELLPGIGDLEPRCDCDAWDHCAHTAALSYQLARLLDQDPFVLLLLRGRGERALLDELQVRSTVRTEPEAPREDKETEGVDAAEAYASAIVLPPLPGPPPLPDEPGLPPSLDTETPPPTGTDVDALGFLGARAAVDAHHMLADALAPGHEQRPVALELTVPQDAVRLAASAPEQQHIRARLAQVGDRGREGLALAVRAWEYGGAAGLSVLEDEWAPDAESAARARTALEAAWEGEERPVLKPARGRWSTADGQAQLRLGRDGRWWPYRKQHGRWTPAGPATPDPASALATALDTGEE